MATGEDLSQHRGKRAQKDPEKRQEAKENLARAHARAAPPVIEGGQLRGRPFPDATGGVAPVSDGGDAAGDDGTAASGAAAAATTTTTTHIGGRRRGAGDATKPAGAAGRRGAGAGGDQRDRGGRGGRGRELGRGRRRRRGRHRRSSRRGSRRRRGRRRRGAQSSRGRWRRRSAAGLTQVLPIGGGSSNLDGPADADLVAEAMSPTTDDAEALDGGQG